MSNLGVSRRFVLLLALVFAFSTLVHVTVGGHGAFAEEHGRELVTASQCDDMAGHSDANGHVKVDSCALGVSCALCAPVTVMAVPALPQVEPIPIASPTTCIDKSLAPRFRPPKHPFGA